MPVYLYEGMDASGSEVTGRIEAPNEANAGSQLRTRGYFVTRLQKINTGAVQNESDVQPPSDVFPGGSENLASQTYSSQRRRLPRWLWHVWCLLFLTLGCLFVYSLIVRPLWGMVRASGWVETPCTIIASDLKEHRRTNSASRGPTFSIQVVYKYEFRGREYQSDQYDFVTTSSNTNVVKRRGIVKELPPGKQAVCFVNPTSPAEAVLERGWSTEMLWGLLPIPFVLIGFFGLFYRDRCIAFLHKRAP